MYLAYNTNGLAHHRLPDALRLLAELGYQGVALTPDISHVDLCTTNEGYWRAVRKDLDKLGLKCVIETGARFVLDPFRKHWPNLLTIHEAAAERRLEYYRRACQMAKILGAEVVSLWSGRPEVEVNEEQAWQRLLARLPLVLDAAAKEGVVVAFEPEPGMLVGDLAAYRRLRRELGRDDLFTTIDIGHLLATEEGAPEKYLEEFVDSLRNVQLEDAHRGVHEHLAIGEGEVDFAAVLAELRRLHYQGPVALELSRDSHRAPEVAREAFDKLSPMIVRNTD